MDAHQIARWTAFLHEQGYRVGEVLGSGMEGTVLDLGDERVVKIWTTRSTEDLATLRRFYDAVAAGASAVRTPVIHQVLGLDGQAASVETRLAGRPLRISMTDDEARGGRHRGRLRARGPRRAPSAAAAPTRWPCCAVLPDEPAFGREVSFEQSLADLVQRRARRFQPSAGRAHARPRRLGRGRDRRA